MDDDLLADDDQFKDDGLDDLDMDAEAALLGISDDENEDDRSQTDDQELEFVDEEGNPVSIGENNADQYEVANIESDKLSNPPDEDILELDLDAELDNFQETSELTESPTPSKSFNTERQRKENLISLTSRKDKERPPLRRKESRYSPEEDKDRQVKDVSFSNQSHAAHSEPSNTYGDDPEYDEESEDENIADDHRERFKSERSNIITLTPKRRADIPDTLESVISVEETAKVQAFLENEQKRKLRFKGKMHGRMKPPPTQRFQRPPQQNFTPTQGQHTPQFSSSNTPSVSQPVSTAPQPRKILINPHFRGLRIPPPTDPGVQTSSHIMPETAPQVSVPPPSSYDTSNYMPPPVQYSHQEPVHSVSAPPPIYTAPPPTVPYKHLEYAPPPQQPVQQMPPPTWQQPPEMPPVQSYSMPPPPVMNYGDPVSQPPPSYNTYTQNYQNTAYQSPPVPVPQSVNYNQPPPPVHLYTQSFPTQPMNPVPASIPHTQYSSPPNQIRLQASVQQPQHYQNTVVNQPPVTSHIQKPRFPQNSQRFSRPGEKRLSNTNIKHVPTKQPRLEHPQRKTNIHVNNSNIREIPLVDTLPAAKRSANKVVPIVEEEDEKTRELRMKIEEQKLLREQILKRKEERRRQMAAQRLLELKKRQSEQNRNTLTIVPKTQTQTNQVKTVQTSKQPAMKPSVKERIGTLNKNLPATKKKIVVVRKKVQQQNVTTPITAPATNVTKASDPVGQRIKLPISAPSQGNAKQTGKVAVTAPSQQSNVIKQPPVSKPATAEPPKPAATTKPAPNKTQTTTKNQKSQPVNPPKKVSLISQAQKIKNLRLGTQRPRSFQGNFQRPPMSPLQRMHRLRIPEPRGRQFPSTQFGEPRMPFRNHGPPMPNHGPPMPNHGPPMHNHGPPMPNRGPPMPNRGPQMSNHGPPMHDMRMPPNCFQEPRPPLLSFHHSPRESGPPYNRFFPPDMPNNPRFRMRGPAIQNFGPRGMEPPRFHHDRFPPPQFRNQMPQMRPMMDNNMQRFQRPPRFQSPVKQRFSPSNSIVQKPLHEHKVLEAKPPTPTPQTSVSKTKPNDTTVKSINDKPASKVVSLVRPQSKNVSNDNDTPKTQSVSIENLSSSTSEAQLRKLCSSVGVIQNIQLLKAERKAVIKFKEPSQALMFQKKYQRYMLDLAMIQVSLLSS